MPILLYPKLISSIECRIAGQRGSLFKIFTLAFASEGLFGLISSGAFGQLIGRATELREYWATNAVCFLWLGASQDLRFKPGLSSSNAELTVSISVFLN